MKYEKANAEVIKFEDDLSFMTWSAAVDAALSGMYARIRSCTLFSVDSCNKITAIASDDIICYGVSYTYNGNVHFENGPTSW